MEWSFQPLDKKIIRDSFDCGVPQLDDYLKIQAGQHGRKGVSKTYVLVSESDLRAIGYYSISMSSIPLVSVPPDRAKGMPRFSALPAMLIGQLARDQSMRGQDVGETLLLDAFKKASQLSSEIGIFAIRVDAISDKAKDFYLSFGFIPYEDQPMATVLELKLSS